MLWLSKSRYRGTVLLSAGILLTGAANFLFSNYPVDAFIKSDQKSEDRMLDSLLAQLEALKPVAGNPETDDEDKLSLSLHTFNPNTIDRSSWLEMGLPANAFESLDRYRKKGGYFRSAAQVQKIPHLGRALASQLESMVRLDTSRGQAGLRSEGEVKKSRSFSGPFNLNTADSLQLKSVFGIGFKTAARIIRYREDLGGFISKEQLYEVWGLDSLVAEELMERSFLTQPPSIRKINPNMAGEEQLCAHPYIRQGLGRLIVRYRKQHRPFGRPEDLLGIRLFRAEQLERLRPYLKFD